MNTLASLTNLQATAAARYNAAVAELYSAYVDLGALDGAISSAQAGGGPIRSFGTNLDELRASLQAHPLAAPLSGPPLSELTAETRTSYIASLTA